MRPLELLLSLANVLALLVLAVPLPGAWHWLRSLVPLALPVAGAQALLEGPRWQMVPAYALAAVLFLAWLLQRSLAPGSRLPGIAVALGLLGLVVSLVPPPAFPVFRLPPPSGPHAIGTLTYHWVDTERPEVFTADPGDRRELMVQVWYPAEGGEASSPRARYVPDGRMLAAVTRLLQMPAFLLSHLEYVATHAIPAAPVAGGEARYPVLIFSHGRAGFRQHNTHQVEALVSHGYIVATIDHPYVASGVLFPDGRVATFDPRLYDPARVGHPAFFDEVIPFLGEDVAFVLDQLAALDRDDPNGILTGRLDVHRAGTFGASLGGLIAAEACLLEPRLRACLAMDVFMPAEVVESGLQQAAMWISRDAETMLLEGWAQADIDETQTTMRAAFQSQRGDGYLVLVPGLFHADFSDAPLYTPLASRLGISGRIDRQRAQSIVLAYSLAFFDKHLKGQTVPLLDGPADEYPEVMLESRQP